MATMNLETLSVRDKFWFHPLISLRYGTSTEQIQQVLTNIRTLLTMHPSLDRHSVRVRLLGFSTSSFNVDVFAYVYAIDWNQFLEIQEGLLFSIMGIVEQTGAQIALPSQVIYVATHSARDRSTLSEMLQPSGPQHTLPSLDAVAATK